MRWQVLSSTTDWAEVDEFFWDSGLNLGKKLFVFLKKAAKVLGGFIFGDIQHRSAIFPEKQRADNDRYIQELGKGFPQFDRVFDNPVWRNVPQ